MKSIRRCFVAFLVIAVSISLGLGCSQDQGQQLSPSETVSEMLEAAKAGNWEKYVDAFYGEQHKFKSSSDRDLVVSRFREKWGDKVIEALEEVSRVEPQLSEDGRTATFRLKNGDFKLYKNEQGNWTFHL